MKKHHILTKAIASVSLLVLATAAHAASLINTNPSGDGSGELFIGFHATGGVGNGASVVVDLGAVSTLSNASVGSSFSLGTFGQDLVNTFGANWYERSDVLWSAAAAVRQTGFSDPQQTVYGSVKVASYDPSLTPTTTAYTRNTQSTQGSAATNIGSNQSNGFVANPTGVTGTNVAIEAAGSTTNNWADWMPGGSQAGAQGPFKYFNSPTNVNFEQAFSAGTIGNGAEGALDVYRMIRTGLADPENSQTSGAGTYQFTLAINSAGAVVASVDPVAVPEPASYGALFSAALLGIGAMRRKRVARA